MSLPEAQGGTRHAPRTRRAPRRRIEDAALAGLPGRLTATSTGTAAGPVDPDATDDVRTVAVLSPTTGAHLLDVEDASPDVLRDDLSAAADASRADWAWSSGEDRARHLFALADVLTGHTLALAVTAALTTGRPVALGTSRDAPDLLDAAFSAAGWADKLAVLGLRAAPGAITLAADWRTPVADLLTGAFAVLATGRAAVLHPDPPVAATCARLVLAADEAGLPPGLLRVVPSRTARTPEVPPAADVVLAGADTDAAAAHLLDVLAAGATGRPGGTRVLVHESLAADLLGRLETGVAALRVGDPLDRATQVGPSPTPDLARAATGARARPVAVPQALPHGGWWALPAVVAAGPRSAPVPAGPLLAVRTVRSGAEALSLLAAAPPVELTLWGTRPGGLDPWRALDGVARIGVDTAAVPDRRGDALRVLRGARG